jgi:hypothetical protein
MRKILETLNKKWAEYVLEIIVIVLSIFGGLQLENWNQDREKRRETEDILSTITANLKSDLVAIDKEILDGSGKNKFWKNLIQESDNDSLASLFIKNITGRYYPVDRAGYGSAVTNNNLKMIKVSGLQADITTYYEEDLKDSERFTKYLIDQAQLLHLESIQQGMLLKHIPTFEGRISQLLKDPSFVENVNSYIRLYSIVLERLESRKLSAQKLIDGIEVELKK